MLTIETFKKRLTKANSPDWLSVAIDVNNVRQLYIVVNGGMGNTISTHIECYPPEIKECIVKMLFSGELIVAKKNCLITRNRYFSVLPIIIMNDKRWSMKKHITVSHQEVCVM